MKILVSAGERRFVAVLALSLFFPAGARGEAGQQEPAPPSAATAGAKISVNVDLVQLRATVRNRKGGLVSGLQKQDFQVYEDGRPQSIAWFQHEDVPVAIGLVVDNSGSMKRKRADVAAAALAFARSSNPEDELFVVNFNEHVTFGLPEMKLFSADPSELVEALMGEPTAGKTALYDAIEAGFSRLQKATRNKEVLIVVSDGGDNASKHTLDEVLLDAARSDAMIYTIGLFDEYDRDRNPGVLRRIAQATGGEAFFPAEPSAAVRICRGIAQEIRSQYTIGYTPAIQNLDGGYRKIRVGIVGHRGEKLLVRTRDGYIAAPAPNSTKPGAMGVLK
ncbi:MAG: VWA domain-containing protein [Candidatus Solibacter sp.]